VFQSAPWPTSVPRSTASSLAFDCNPAGEEALCPDEFWLRCGPYLWDRLRCSMPRPALSLRFWPKHIYSLTEPLSIASLSHFPRQVGLAWESLQDCTLRVVIRSGIGTPSLARPKLLSSFRFLLRSGGSRSAPTVTLLLLAFVSHSQQVALVLTGVNVSEPIYTSCRLIVPKPECCTRGCRHGIGWAVGAIVRRDHVEALMEDQG
jgi:hypothetical protein